MKKKKVWDYVNNNPRANKQYIDQKETDEEDRFNDEMMLYDENLKGSKRLDLIRRMVRAYNKNIEKVEKRPQDSPLSAAEKRARKLEDLLTRWYSWKNLQ